MEAFLGKLTENWRAQNSNVKHPNELLNQILDEKEQLILRKRIKRDKKLSSISEKDIPFEVPNTWIWCFFGDLILQIEAGKSPKCLPIPSSIDQWGVIKISAVTWGSFDESENKTLPLNIPPFKDKEILPSDFLMTRANTPELVARSVIVQENVRKKLLLNDKTLRVSLSGAINKEYINLFNNSSYARYYYMSVATGTSDSMKNVSRDSIKSLPIPLPSKEEQREVVKRTKSILEKCDRLESEYEIKQEKRRSSF